MCSLKYLRVILATMPLFLVLGMPSVSAASANVSRSYHATSSIPNGSLVSLDSNHQGNVVAADTSNASKLLGVTLPSQDSLLAIDPSNTTIQVALNGSVSTLVSTVDGNIKVGDQVGASPFAGIGMEALPGSHIIGVAQTSFTSKTSGVTTEQVKDKAGQTHQIDIGYIRVAIAVGTGASTSGGGSQANFLQRIIKSLTGKTISTVRIVLSLVVMVVALVSLVTLIYASIYGSIISVGRNPLAKNAIFRTLTSVMIMAIITVGVACVTIYYLLR
jgi:hypothetical protein